MREILFRGKQKDNGEWIEGYVFDDDLINSSKKFVGGIVIENNKLTGTNFYEVIPETVGQYTGIIDKNGKKIFEGDIVKSYGATREAKHKKAVVQWDKLFSSWKANNSQMFGSKICEVYEIIGNIYDNPELLKEV